MLLGLHYDASSAEYKVDVRATTTTMEVMTRRLTGHAPSDGFTTPKKSSKIVSSVMAYPFPYYTVTIGHRDFGEVEPTQVQGDDGEALPCKVDVASLADLVIRCTCDDPRKGLCKHAALAARLLLVRAESTGQGREGVPATISEEVSSAYSSTTSSPPESDIDECGLLRASSSLLPGLHLYQVVVPPDITCSIVMKDPRASEASSSVAMTICSACPERQSLERCEHIVVAVDTIEKQSSKERVVDSPAKSGGIARRLVFTENTTELKGEPYFKEDTQKSLVVMEDDDSAATGSSRNGLTSSGLKRRRSVTDISAEVSRMAFTAAMKPKQRRQCENLTECIAIEKRPSGGGGEAMPGSYRALLQQYL